MKIKSRKKKYDYGEYEICNTSMEEKYIKQDFWIRGELIVVEDVPAGVCPQCGVKVVKADVGLPPDLPGCVATSTTRDEVEQNMYEAIELHLQGLKEDGLSIPKSTSFAEYIAIK